MSEQKCNTCKGEGWVCENHPDIAWNGGNQSCCGGAGVPCSCNTSNPPWAFGFDADEAHDKPEKILETK